MWPRLRCHMSRRSDIHRCLCFNMKCFKLRQEIIAPRHWKEHEYHQHLFAPPQDAISSGGPLLAVLGFLILPLVWSVPEALVTAELATTFPENSGYVAWVTAAFGPFWGFQVRAHCPLFRVQSCT